MFYIDDCSMLYFAMNFMCNSLSCSLNYLPYSHVLIVGYSYPQNLLSDIKSGRISEDILFSLQYIKRKGTVASLFSPLLLEISYSAVVFEIFKFEGFLSRSILIHQFHPSPSLEDRRAWSLSPFGVFLSPSY